MGLPLQPTLDAVGEAGLARLYADMLRAAPADGIAIESEGAVAPLPGQSSSAWAVRTQRARAMSADRDPGNRLALKAARAAMIIDPRLRLTLVANTAGPAGPPPFADTLLLKQAADAAAFGSTAAQLRDAGWLRPTLAGRVALALPEVDGVKALLAAQQLGAAGFALCPSGAPPIAGAPDATTSARNPLSPGFSPAFSSATFPFKP